MIVLDTDHLSVYSNANHSGYGRLVERMLASSDQNFVTTIVSAEEQMRGWLADIHRERIRAQVLAYHRLLNLLNFLGRFPTFLFPRLVPMSSNACENSRYASGAWI